MEPAQLLPHLATGLRLALGDRELEGAPPGRIRGAVFRSLGAVHPSFGRMRPKDWDVLQYRHFDHHLRQFGV